MFVPIHDNTPLKLIRFQWVTLVIMVANGFVFLWSNCLATPLQHNAELIFFGVIPQDFVATLRSTGTHDMAFEALSLVSSLFFHDSWLHIIGNLAFLWVFADNVEDAFGHLGFAFFYVLCGIGGVLMHVAILPDSTMPLIGASSAVAGVIGSYLVLFPRARVWILIYIPIPLPAYWALFGWLAFQILNIFWATPDSNVALWSHVGGFITGLALTLLLRRQISSTTRGQI